MVKIGGGVVYALDGGPRGGTKGYCWRSNGEKIEIAGMVVFALIHE